MNLKNHFVIAAALYGGATVCMGQSAWLPARGELKATPGFSFSTFDEFWMGDSKVSNPPNGDSLNQYTGYISLEYGIIENVAADIIFGYTATESGAFGNEDDTGMMDTLLGFRYRVVNEQTASQRWVPTVSLRVGGVIPGTYEPNLPFSPGDGVYAFDMSLLLGKAFGESGFGLYGDIGYRVRVNPAPNEVFGMIGAYQQIGPVTLTVGYVQVQSLSGLDIGGTGFNPAAGADSGFPALREINYIFQGGITYTDKGGRSYQFTAGTSLAGRNTGDKLMLGINVTIPFGPFGQ
jgi:hypothetical protein